MRPEFTSVGGRQALRTTAAVAGAGDVGAIGVGLLRGRCHRLDSREANASRWVTREPRGALGPRTSSSQKMPEVTGVGGVVKVCHASASKLSPQ